VVIVTRTLSAFRQLEAVTQLPLVFVRRLSELNELMHRVDPKVCLYVNNAAPNFQLLSWSRALHVHVNHGESDKISMASNQAKAYDRVFVAGEAAEIRYRRNLLEFDDSRLVRVGRPQLDLAHPSAISRSERRTVLYAPTWQGETDAMNYTSVPVLGVALVSALAAAGYRVIYKPHPRVATGAEAVAAAHREIIAMLQRQSVGFAEAERHVVELQAPIQQLFADSDAMICDVSSVGLDWLYLRVDAPIWICDPRGDRAALLDASPLAASTDVIDAGAVPGIAELVDLALREDPRRDDRRRARELYFGELAPGESTVRFLAAIDEVIERRDEQLVAVAATHSVQHESEVQ
jgi:hypothetical protein